MTEKENPSGYFEKYSLEERRVQAEALLNEIFDRLSVSEIFKDSFLSTALGDSRHSLENYTVFYRGEKEVKVACRNNNDKRSVRVLIKEGQFSRVAWAYNEFQKDEDKAFGLIHFTFTRSQPGEPDVSMIRHNTPEAVDLVREVFNEAFPIS